MKNIKFLTFSLTIAALAIYFTFRNVSLPDLYAAFGKVNYRYLSLFVLFFLIDYCARTLRWRTLISSMKIVSFAGLFPIMVISQLGNLLPMRAGEILRSYLLKKKYDLPFAGAFATIVVERLFDILILMILSTWILVFQSHLFSRSITILGLPLQEIAFKFGFASLAVSGGIIFIIYMMLFQDSRFTSWVRLLTSPLPNALRDKIWHLASTFAHGLHVVKDIRSLFLTFFFSVAEWVVVAASYYPFYLAFDLQNKSYESVVLMAVVIPIFMIALPTPGFLGSVQAGVFIVLHEIMGETEAVAAGFGMVVWGWGLATQIFFGILFVMREHLTVAQLSKLEEEGEAAFDKIG